MPLAALNVTAKIMTVSNKFPHLHSAQLTAWVWGGTTQSSQCSCVANSWLWALKLNNSAETHPR